MIDLYPNINHMQEVILNENAHEIKANADLVLQKAINLTPMCNEFCEHLGVTGMFG